jgi:transposase-like protein
LLQTIPFGIFRSHHEGGNRHVVYCSPLSQAVLELSIPWLTRKGVSHVPPKWEAKIKALIVIQGLQGKPVAGICNAYQLSQSQYYQGRDQCLAHASHAFEAQQHGRQEARLAQEHARLKTLVGELTLELQKSDELWG